MSTLHLQCSFKEKTVLLFRVVRPHILILPTTVPQWLWRLAADSKIMIFGPCFDGDKVQKCLCTL